jgi:GT2 family glycosyltransferase
MAIAVSVIIVTYQSQDDIAACLRSVLLCPLPVEIIVVDNASTDRTVEQIRRVIAMRPHCALICNSDNVGFAKAVNMGLRRATGTTALILNPDCILRTDTITQGLKALNGHPTAAMTGCMLLNEDGSEQAGARRYLPTPWRSLVRVLPLHRLTFGRIRPNNFLMNHEPVPDHPIEVEATSGAFMLVRRDAIEQVGALDEGYFMHCEDLDWCVRFRQAGWQILFTPAARAVHKKGRSSQSRPIRVELYKHVGMVRFYRKFFRQRYPLALMWAVIAAVWARFTLKAGAMACASTWRRVAQMTGAGPAGRTEAGERGRPARYSR